MLVVSCKDCSKSVCLYIYCAVCATVCTLRRVLHSSPTTAPPPPPALLSLLPPFMLLLVIQRALMGKKTNLSGGNKTTCTALPKVGRPPLWGCGVLHVHLHLRVVFNARFCCVFLCCGLVCCCCCPPRPFSGTLQSSCREFHGHWERDQ